MPAIKMFAPLSGMTQAALLKAEIGSGPLTFTRATTATRINPVTNLIEAVASGDLREDGRKYKNMLPHSEAINGSYGVLDGFSEQGASLASDTAVDPKGRITATIMREDSLNGVHQAYHVPFLENNRQYVWSFFIRKGSGRDWINLYTSGKGPSDNFAANFNVHTGVKGTVTGAGVTSGITPLGNGWFRIWISYPSNSGSATTYIAPRMANAEDGISYQGDGSSYFVIWGMQLEEGFTPRRYVKTGSTRSFVPKGVLIEGQRTNLCFRSEEFSTAPWSTGAASVSVNADAAPDGNVTMDRIVEDNTTAAHYVQQGFSKASSALPYSYSVYAKPGSRTRLVLYIYGASSGDRIEVDFNLAAGMVVSAATFGGFSSGSGKIEIAPNGSFRCTAMFTSDATASLIVMNVLHNGTSYIYAGNGSGYLSVWGAQLEQIYSPSSYIPTTSSAVTRNQDVLTKGTGDLSGTEGVFFVEAELDSIQAASNFYAIDLGSNRPIVYASNGAGAVIAHDGLNTFSPGYYLAAKQRSKIAMRYGNAAFGATVDGKAVITGAFDGDMNLGATMQIGGANLGTGEWYGHLKNLIFCSGVPSDAEMVAMTT